MNRKIVVTSALPYANGPIHIGHLVEYLQTDIWVRFQKANGNQCLYFCADDTHGTPIMIKARSEGIEPEQLIKKVHAEHIRDFKNFHIEFDNYYSTHSEENRQLSTLIFSRLVEKGSIVKNEVEQAFCDKCSMFLRPRDLRDDGLMEGLQRLTAEFLQNTKTELSLNGPKNDHLGDLPQAHAMALFHICQEALANIARHAQATRVTVDLWASADRVLLEIHDDGRGFFAADVNKMVGHGLANMLTRVHNVGGDLDVSSVPGEGTTILAWVPRSQGGRSG